MKTLISINNEFRIEKFSETISKKLNINKSELIDKSVFSIFYFPQELNNKKKLADALFNLKINRSIIVYSKYLNCNFFELEFKDGLTQNLIKIKLSLIDNKDSENFLSCLDAKLLSQFLPNKSFFIDRCGNVIKYKINESESDIINNQTFKLRINDDIFTNEKFISSLNNRLCYNFSLNQTRSSAKINISPMFFQQKTLIGFLLIVCEHEDNIQSDFIERSKVPYIKVNSDFKLTSSHNINKIFQSKNEVEMLINSSSFKNIIKNNNKERLVIDENFFFNSKLYRLIIIPFSKNILIYFTDIKSVNNKNPELEHNLEQQDLISKIVLNLNALGDINDRINETLRLLGEHKQVSRVYIFQDDDAGLTTSNTYEWCNYDIKPEIDNLQNIPLEFFPDWNKLLSEKGMFVSNKIDELPKELKDLFEPQGIKSIIILPIYKNFEIAGFIGFDDCLIKRIWTRSELSLLKTVAQLIGSVFEKEELDNGLKKTNRDLYWKNLSLKHYAFKLSHNLRNPLSNILNAARLLKLSYSENNKAIIFETINKSATEIDKSITELTLLANHNISVSDSIIEIKVTERLHELSSRLIIISDLKAEILVNNDELKIFKNETLFNNAFTLVFYNLIKNSDKDKTIYVSASQKSYQENQILLTISFNLDNCPESVLWLESLNSKVNTVDENEYIDSHLIKEYFSELGFQIKLNKSENHQYQIIIKDTNEK
jgi:signal transduction histidine kinase